MGAQILIPQNFNFKPDTTSPAVCVASSIAQRGKPCYGYAQLVASDVLSLSSGAFSMFLAFNPLALIEDALTWNYPNTSGHGLGTPLLFVYDAIGSNKPVNGWGIFLNPSVFSGIPYLILWRAWNNGTYREGTFLTADGETVATTTRLASRWWKLAFTMANGSAVLANCSLNGSSLAPHYANTVGRPGALSGTPKLWILGHDRKVDASEVPLGSPVALAAAIYAHGTGSALTQAQTNALTAGILQPDDPAIFGACVMRTFSGAPDWSRVGSPDGQEVTDTEITSSATGAQNRAYAWFNDLAVLPLSAARDERFHAMMIYAADHNNVAVAFGGKVFVGWCGLAGSSQGIYRFDGSTGSYESSYLLASALYQGDTDWFHAFDNSSTGIDHWSPPTLAASANHLYLVAGSARQGPGVPAWRRLDVAHVTDMHSITADWTIVTLTDDFIGLAGIHDGTSVRSVDAGYNFGLAVASLPNGGDRLVCSGAWKLSTGAMAAALFISDDAGTAAADATYIPRPLCRPFTGQVGEYFNQPVVVDGDCMASVAAGLYGEIGLFVFYSENITTADPLDIAIAAVGGYNGVPTVPYADYTLADGGTNATKYKTNGMQRSKLYPDTGDHYCQVPCPTGKYLAVSRILLDAASRTVWILYTVIPKESDTQPYGWQPDSVTCPTYLAKVRIGLGADTSTQRVYVYGPFFSRKSRNNMLGEMRWEDEAHSAILLSFPDESLVVNANDPQAPTRCDHGETAGQFRVVFAELVEGAAAGLHRIGNFSLPATGGNPNEYIDGFPGDVLVTADDTYTVAGDGATATLAGIANLNGLHAALSAPLSLKLYVRLAGRTDGIDGTDVFAITNVVDDTRVVTFAASTKPAGGATGRGWTIARTYQAAYSYGSKARIRGLRAVERSYGKYVQYDGDQGITGIERTFHPARVRILDASLTGGGGGGGGGGAAGMINLANPRRRGRRW